MRAAIYVRVSTEEQALHGYSLAEQREACRKKAEELGAEAVVEFADEGHSGAVLERPGLTALREAVARGEVDLIVVRDPDRLSRKLAHQLLLTEEFERAGVRLEFVEYEWRDTPEGRLFYSIRGAIAEYEREKIRDRTVRGKLTKAKQGKIPHRFHVYGYDYDPETGEVKINEEEARILKQVFDWFVNEDIGTTGIAKRLNALGVPSKNGGKWYQTVVANVLSNPTYTGTWFFNRRDCSVPRRGRDYPLKPEEEWIPIPVPPIIDPETFEQAQEKLKKIRRLYAGRNRPRHLLAGLATCGHCGEPMPTSAVGVWGKYYARTYACRGCGNRVRADRLEPLVWEVVTSLLRDPDALMREIRREREDPALEQELGRVEEALERVEKGRAAVLDALSAGLLDLDEEVAARLAEIKRRREELLQRKAALEEALRAREKAERKIDDLRRRAEEFLSRLDGLEDGEKRGLVRLLVEEVLVYRTGVPGHRTVTVCLRTGDRVFREIFWEKGRGKR
ncbi:recombinase family protein [Ammonifex thiophilus]|uniref:Recombinase family protein n=1 Tax=Ammonifex thiophilus TaxID=444093 RepID=A0A3D8P4T3_9THEO|nr:recombinase family protein [Ammonifex thiophilus]RDV82974.1 recombinase family protein [Ammonifex thiophilus]